MTKILRSSIEYILSFYSLYKTYNLKLAFHIVFYLFTQLTLKFILVSRLSKSQI